MTLLHDRYELTKPLGQGGGGQTWLARDTQTGASVTIKELRVDLRGDAKAVVEREARLLGQLNHPQIPRFVQAFVEDVRMVPRLHLVLEHVPGEPLSEIVARKRLTQGEAIALIDDLLSVLAWLHALSPPMIHRDIKPQNLIVRPDGRVVLIDFGSATDAGDRTFMHTMVVGTLGYQAPEQIIGEPCPGSDVYGAGVVALELLTRRDPRALLSGQRLRWQGPAKALSPALQAWLARALAPEPADRFANADEALRALRAGDSAPATSPDRDPSTPATTGGANAGVMAGGAAAALGLVASLGLLFGWIGAFVGLIGSFVLAFALARRFVTPGADELLVIEGRGSSLRIARSRVWLMPFLERAERLSTSRAAMRLTVDVFRGATSFAVTLDARFGIDPREPFALNAYQRFVGRAADEPETVARAMLQGIVPEVLQNAAEPPSDWSKPAFRFAFAPAILAYEADFQHVGLQLYDLDIVDVRAAEATP